MEFLSSAPGTFLCLIICLALVLLGNKFLKIHIGIGAMILAWVWGVLILGESASTITGYFNTSMFIKLFAMIGFYSVGIFNGTMSLLSKKILYPFRNHAFLAPLGCYIVGAVMGLTIGSSAASAFVPLLSMSIAIAGGWNPLLFLLIAQLSSPAFGCVPWSFSGATVISSIETTELAATADIMGFKVGVNSMILYTLMTVVLYFLTKAYKIKKVEMERPEPFNREQKNTLILLGAVIIIIVITSLGSMFGAGEFAAFCKKFDITYVCLAGIGVALFTGIGKTSDLFVKNKIPAYFMICGIQMLVTIANKAGAFTWLCNDVLAVYVPEALIVPAMGILACAMCMLISWLVTVPTLYMLIPAIATAFGINPVRLFTVVFCCAMIGTVSPLSAGGAVCNAQCPDEGKRLILYKDQLKWVPICCLIIIVFDFVGLSRILG